MRISKVLRLCPAEVDSQRMVIRVKQGKGAKDRYVMLSPGLDSLRDYWRRTRPAGKWPLPGLIPGRHLTRDAVSLARKSAFRRSGVLVASHTLPRLGTRET